VIGSRINCSQHILHTKTASENNQKKRSFNRRMLRSHHVKYVRRLHQAAVSTRRASFITYKSSSSAFRSSSNNYNNNQCYHTMKSTLYNATTTEKHVDLEQVQEVLSKKHIGGHPLDHLFKPKTIAVVGASEVQGTTGRTILWNLMSCQAIKVYPVNLNKKSTVLGLTAYPSVESIFQKLNISSIDLAVICSPKEKLLQSVEDCIQSGIKAAVLVSPNSTEVVQLSSDDKKLYNEIKNKARKAGMRILGPNCMGIMIPSVKPNGQATFINATYAGTQALHGRVAVISQSSELSTTILDWSLKKNVGFSAFMSIGSMLDISWGDLIDYYGRDEQSDAIILYMEDIGSIENARHFLSAARTVALKKPIIILKSRRTQVAYDDDNSQTASLINSDQVLDAIFERCGVLRVDTIEDLFNMAQVLSKQPRPKGNRIVVVSNSQSAALLATDSLIGKGEIAQLSPDTINSISKIIPGANDTSNPLFLLQDAKPERYIDVIDILAKDPNIDAILAILTPQEFSEPTRTAQLIKQQYSPSILSKSLNDQPVILTCWMGGLEVEVGRDLLVGAGIPSFIFPDTVVTVFNYMWRYSKNLENLYDIPSTYQQSRFEKVSEANITKAKQLLEKAIASNRSVLTEHESKQILELYGIPTANSIIARTSDEAVQAANKIGYPVVLKIHSESINKKLDVNGVKLNLHDDEAIRRCFSKIQQSVEKYGKNSDFTGVTVQPMIKQEGNESTFEVILGSTYDKQFGPVILFGLGGSYVQISQDTALAVPPLTQVLARKLISKTQIYNALKGHRQKPGVDMDLIHQLIVRFSQFILDLTPYIKSVDMNPIMISSAPLMGAANHQTIIALDAKIVLHTDGIKHNYTPAIRRYPEQYVTNVQLKKNILAVIRPIRFEDHPRIVDFFGSLSKKQLELSAKEEALNYEGAFYNLKKQQDRAVSSKHADHQPEPLQLQNNPINRQIYNELLQFCIGDYDREMSLCVQVENNIVAVGRYTISPQLHEGSKQAEIAVLVRESYQSAGVGKLLLAKIIEVARKEGVNQLIAHIHHENVGMQQLTTKLGFKLHKESLNEDFVMTSIEL
jgi:acetyltransferase